MSIDPRSIREYYWEPFRSVITDGGAKCIMTAYNAVNGVPMIVNPVVKKKVREEWGLEGFIVCDAEDFRQNVNIHRYCGTHAETAAFALKNGIDSFTDDPELVINSVKGSFLNEGLISESDMESGHREHIQDAYPGTASLIQGTGIRTKYPGTCFMLNSIAVRPTGDARKSIVLLKRCNIFATLKRKRKLRKRRL